MATETISGAKVLGSFYDEAAYTLLFSQQQGAVTAAYGFVGGQPVYSVLQSGEALYAADTGVACRTLELAAKTGNPVVPFYNTKGAKLEEGQAAVAAAATWNAAIAAVSGVVPQISVVVGVCGASAALAAASADLCIVAKDAQFFLSSPFLAEAGGDKLENAGTAEFAAKAGIAALVAEDVEDAVAKAAKLVALLPSNNLSLPGEFEYDEPAAAVDTAAYTAEKAIAALADSGSQQEVFAGFGSAVSTVFATVEGNVAGFVATAGPGKTICRASAEKAARFVRLCDAFSVPVVTLVNTEGFAQSSSGDVAGGIRAAARLVSTYADATTAKVAVYTGKAVGTAYTAFSSADLTVAMEGAVIAPAEPTAVVSVLYRQQIEESGKPVAAETAALAREYEARQASAEAALQNGLADFVAAPEALRATVANALGILASKRARRLPKKHGNMPL
ncbi:MAG: carboxyl transferase domain-containing protein [Oscillospiraceae bacterium]